MNALFTSMTAQVAYDGQPAKLIELTNRRGMRVVVMDIGATWLSCTLPMGDESREVLLGVSSMDDFVRQGSYLGATVGRYANRIARGELKIGTQTYALSVNQAGNTLHCGVVGFDRRRWQITQQSAQHVTFQLLSADGEQGFPGNLHVAVTYRLDEQGGVNIDYQATTDRATAVNLTNHAYFNLNGAEQGSDCLNHQLWIDAKQFLPTDASGIPLGELQSVLGSGFDFTQPKRVGEICFKINSKSVRKAMTTVISLRQSEICTRLSLRCGLPMRKCNCSSVRINLLCSFIPVIGWREHPIALVRTTRITLASL